MRLKSPDVISENMNGGRRAKRHLPKYLCHLPPLLYLAIEPGVPNSGGRLLTKGSQQLDLPAAEPPRPGSREEITNDLPLGPAIHKRSKEERDGNDLLDTKRLLDALDDRPGGRRGDGREKIVELVTGDRPTSPEGPDAEVALERLLIHEDAGDLRVGDAHRMFSIPGDFLLPPVYLLLSRKAGIHVKSAHRKRIIRLKRGHHGPHIAQVMHNALRDTLENLLLILQPGLHLKDDLLRYLDLQATPLALNRSGRLPTKGGQDQHILP